MDIGNKLSWIGHAGVYYRGEKGTVFIDPFKVSDSVKERADIILITHPHFDHCSPADIRKVAKSDAIVLHPSGCAGMEEFKGARLVKPGERIEFEALGMSVETLPAYNVNPSKLAFHPKANGWVSYLVTVDGFKMYHGGDTDFIEEMKALAGRGVDAALLPIGGTYTMDVSEAIEAMKAIRPKAAIPMHYKNLLGVEGSRKAEEAFRKALPNAVLLKEVQEPSYGFERE